MNLFGYAVLWQRIYMQPGYILFHSYWVWPQMSILDDFISDFLKPLYSIFNHLFLFLLPLFVQST